jgi:hypothetical protein
VYQLLDETQADKDDPSGQYVLLKEAEEVAIRVGDFSAAFHAARELFEKYDVPAMDVIADLMKRMGPRLVGQDAADGATVTLLLVEAFDKKQAFGEARKWLPSTRAIAYASHNSKVISAVGEAVARVEFDAAAAERAQAAMAKLKSDPNDPAANLVAGEYRCFTCDDFAAGCALLSKGNDAAMKHAADADLAKPATPADQKACGDLWWEQSIAQVKTPVVADACKARAIFWYRQAEPELTGLVRRSVDQRLGDVAQGSANSRPQLPAHGATQEAPAGPPKISIAAAAGWVPTDQSVEKGQCYEVAATGVWTDSEGVRCGPSGACPAAVLKLLGPQDITKEQRDQFYSGQHPRGALICRIGDENWDFYVPSRCRFVAPASGKLSFRMNDEGPVNARARSGACTVTIARVEPEWVRPDGRVQIIARIDSTDWLHLSHDGPYWEWDGNWGKVGIQDGIYPTVINGIYWWPQWSHPKKTEPLLVSSLWPRQPTQVRIVAVEAKRGEAVISFADNDEVIVQFHKQKGLGASQIGVVLALKPDAGR